MDESTADNLVISCDTQYLKRKLRRKKVAAREALTPEERREKSASIIEHVRTNASFRKAKTVMIYRSVRGEVQLDTLPEAAPEKRYVYPLCIGKTKMLAYEAETGDPKAWKKGAFGILEPDPKHAGEVHPEEIDLVICPCTSFDREHNRLGMGAGYYDRFLERCVNAEEIAVAFAVQETDRVPAEHFDYKMRAVITENGEF